MGKREVIQQAWHELDGELAEHGYELVEVEYSGQSGATVLRLFIDRPGGVTLDHCAEVSRLLSPLLDLKDFIHDSYTLEVSSPGFDRPIRKSADFARFVGESVRVETETPVLGRSRFRGALTDFSDGTITVECDGEPYEVNIDNVKKARLVR